MQLQDFLKQLNQGLDRELEFHLGLDQLNQNYHITEVLHSQISAIDCGGQVDQWQETILQLVSSSRAENEKFMDVTKALKIMEQSFKKINFAKDSELILEFKPEGAQAAQRFHVAKVNAIGKKLVVTSDGASTQCKAAVRANPEGHDTCCGPRETVKSSKTCCG